MHRLIGVILPEQKRIDYALTLVYGIGWTRAEKVLSSAGVKSSKRVKDITEDEFKSIVQFIEKNFKVEGDLRSDISQNIKKLREIKSYRGMRHAQSLPVRGQRTRSNARTKRGKRRTVGALSKEAWAKIETNTTK
jgi:small subunit ribosomal protein S13